MIEGWEDMIAAAQAVQTCVVNGTRYGRVRYGEEEDDWGSDEHDCHDCAVTKGQFHVPGCDVERCPACGGQFISCDCNRGEDVESS